MGKHGSSGFIRAIQEADSFVARLIMWFLFLFVAIPLLYAAFVIIVVATSPEARAATPATVKVIGTPASVRMDCDIARRFAEEVIGWRDKGGSIEQAHADAITWRIANGATPEQACMIVASVNAIWTIQGNAAGIGQMVYSWCMKGRA
jgi:hypothetical protein